MAIDPNSLVFDTAPEGDITEAGESTQPRRGRPPGTKNGEGRGRRSTAENRTVAEAMGAMQSAYDLLGLLLKPIAPNAARIFSEGVPKAQESNRRAFEASPKLAKRVASTGERGGSAAFFIGNAVLIAPVVAAASVEIQGKMPAKAPKAPKPTQRPQQQPTQPRQDIPRPNIPAAEGFEIPNVPIWNPNKPNAV